MVGDGVPSTVQIIRHQVDDIHSGAQPGYVEVLELGARGRSKGFAGGRQMAGVRKCSRQHRFLQYPTTKQLLGSQIEAHLIPSCIGCCTNEVRVSPEGREAGQCLAQLDKKADIVVGIVQST